LSTVIEDVVARKIFNSRGEETLEIDVVTTAGFGRASAPSGASRGKAEVVPYPKGGVSQAITKVEEIIAPELIGMNAEEQEQIDFLLHKIDGTKDFRNIGGNTAYAISLATADAASSSYGIPLFQQLAGYLASELPHPLGNVLGGGKHARGKTPDIQEFLVLPIKAESFSEAAKANVLVHQKVGVFLKKSDATFTGGKGDEGAWAPSIKNEDALEIMMKACEEVSEETGVECRVGLDIAASTLWRPREKRYVYTRDGVKRDDLFVTNKERLTSGIEVGAGNAVIIKTNQVGTLTDAWETTKIAREARYVPVMSHRSGETPNAHIAHLAVAFHCPIIKTGIIPGERIAKINELIRIEEMLGERAKMSTLTL